MISRKNFQERLPRKISKKDFQEKFPERNEGEKDFLGKKLGKRGENTSRRDGNTSRLPPNSPRMENVLPLPQLRLLPWDGKRIPRNSGPILTLDQLHHFQVGAVGHHRPVDLGKHGKGFGKGAGKQGFSWECGEGIWECGEGIRECRP